MAANWTADDLRLIDAAEELRIASRRADGTLRHAVPIWVVRVGEQVYVRTWYRRDTGWFGQVLASGRAAVEVPGLRADVTVTDVAGASDRLRADVDAAYRAKYGRYGASTVAQMVADEAVATTLRLSPAE